MRPVIVSRKHYVQFTEFNTPSLTVTTQEWVDSVAVQDKNTPKEVEEGSIVKAIFVELWLVTDSGSVSGSFVVTVEKFEQNVGPPSLSEMTTLDSYDNKKNVLFVSQGILGNESTGNPTPVLRQWIKIPKGKQRMGLRDGVRINIAAIGAPNLTGCSFAVYKEYK